MIYPDLFLKNGKINTECCKKVRHSIVKVEEKGKSFKIKNFKRKQIIVCTVDGCLINQESKKCDFIFLLDSESPKKIILVELKGSNYAEAVRQIIETAEHLKLGEIKIEKHSYIVGSPSPKAGTTYQNEIKKHKERYETIGLSLPIRKEFEIQVDHS
jgi:hypothetical protein